jgi:hypothetical protein
MPIPYQEVLEKKRKHYEENRDAIKAKNLQRYHAKRAQMNSEEIRPRGRPRKVFPPKTD